MKIFIHGGKNTVSVATVRMLLGDTFIKILATFKVETDCNYTDYNDHHHYNLTGSTIAFDRTQQRRKELVKQHFVKPVKKAKKREKRVIDVTWR